MAFVPYTGENNNLTIEDAMSKLKYQQELQQQAEDNRRSGLIAQGLDPNDPANVNASSATTWGGIKSGLGQLLTNSAESLKYFGRPGYKSYDQYDRENADKTWTKLYNSIINYGKELDYRNQAPIDYKNNLLGSIGYQMGQGLGQNLGNLIS